MLHGPEVIRIKENNTADMLCADTETIYTEAYSLKRGTAFAVAYKVSSVAEATVDITIVVEQSYKAPAAGSEEASDATFVTPASMSAICENRTTETTLVIQSLSPVPMPFIRFKITGAGSNAPDTVVNMWLACQES